MTTQPAPLLTAYSAQLALEAICPKNAEPIILKEWEQTAVNELSAVVDGRTACVRVMSEDECRAQFEKWQRETCCMPDWWLVRSGDEYVESDAMHEWECWLACARANGLVSGEKK